MKARGVKYKGMSIPEEWAAELSDIRIPGGPHNQLRFSEEHLNYLVFAREGMDTPAEWRKLAKVFKERFGFGCRHTIKTAYRKHRGIK